MFFYFCFSKTVNISKSCILNQFPAISIRVLSYCSVYLIINVSGDILKQGIKS